ncbi:unnamed protein product, partial [Didymodactylos carnosus]
NRSLSIQNTAPAITTGIVENCCLSKLEVDCRVECERTKRKSNREKHRKSKRGYKRRLLSPNMTLLSTRSLSKFDNEHHNKEPKKRYTYYRSNSPPIDDELRNEQNTGITKQLSSSSFTTSSSINTNNSTSTSTNNTANTSSSSTFSIISKKSNKKLANYYKQQILNSFRKLQRYLTAVNKITEGESREDETVKDQPLIYTNYLMNNTTSNTNYHQQFKPLIFSCVPLTSNHTAVTTKQKYSDDANDKYLDEEIRQLKLSVNHLIKIIAQKNKQPEGDIIEQLSKEMTTAIESSKAEVHSNKNQTTTATTKLCDSVKRIFSLFGKEATPCNTLNKEQYQSKIEDECRQRSIRSRKLLNSQKTTQSSCENYCIVHGCPNGSISHPSVQRFSVPTHLPNIAHQWYKNTMRTDLRPSSQHSVCECHFEESCFEHVSTMDRHTGENKTTKCLKTKSLPTLFDLEVFYKMIAYQDKLQESNKTIKKTNITFHTSNPELDGKTLEPILKMNLESGHVKTRLAPTSPGNKDTQPSPVFEGKATNRCFVEGCEHAYVARRHRVQLYKIPRDPGMARKWLDACGSSAPVSPATSVFKVCREHFTPMDFEGPTTLRLDAVPSQFTPRSCLLMNKQLPEQSTIRQQSYNDDANSEMNHSNNTKRFRSDNVAMIRPKHSTVDTKRLQKAINTQPYVNYNQARFRSSKNSHFPQITSQYQSFSQQHSQKQDFSPPLSPLPRRESIEESIKQMIRETKQQIDVELNMSCSEEQLSDAQLSHFPVKVLDKMANSAKKQNARSRPPPRQPTRTYYQQQSDIFDDDEMDDIAMDYDDDVGGDSHLNDKDWLSQTQDDRLPWSKRGGRVGHFAYNRGGSANSLYRVGNGSVGRNSVPSANRSREHFLNTQFVKPEATRKASIPFLQPAFDHPITHYPRDQPLPRIKPGSVRTREEGLEVELEQTYRQTLTKYYGQKPGGTIALSEYGDYRSKCSACNETLENNIQLIIHLCKHFENKQQDEQQEQKEEKREDYISPFNQIQTKCEQCRSEFSNPYYLYMHIDEKHMLNLNEYQCRICQQKHGSLLELIAHLNLCHCGLEMPYYCEVCTFRTSMYSDMIYHIDELHKNTRYFFCPYCFAAIQLPLLNNSLFLNGSAAFKHLLLHFNKVDNGRATQSKFKHCRKCTLHVKSIKDHLTRDHLNIVDGIKAMYYNDADGTEKQSENECDLDIEDSLDENATLEDKTLSARYITPSKV